MEIIYWNYEAVGVELGPRIIWFANAPEEAKLNYASYRPFPENAWLNNGPDRAALT